MNASIAYICIMDALENVAVEMERWNISYADKHTFFPRAHNNKHDPTTWLGKTHSFYSKESAGKQKLSSTAFSGNAHSNEPQISNIRLKVNFRTKIQEVNKIHYLNHWQE